MLDYIEGKLVRKEATSIVVQVGGLAFQLKVSLNTSSQLSLGKEGRIFTYLLVREDLLALYGFIDPDERAVFLDLISVSGIGANTAIVMLSSLSTKEIIQAIAGEEVGLIQSVKGIGKKTAERVILELKEKIKKNYPEGEFELSSEGGESTGNFKQVKSEAIEALLALGLNKQAAEKNISQVIKRQGMKLSLEELIKFALKS